MSGTFVQALAARISTAALDRLYRALASTAIVVFDPDEAPRIPLAGTRVRRVHLDIDAPADRFFGDSATLILLWNMRMEGSRALAERLAKLAVPIAAPGLATLSIVIDQNAATAVRRLTGSRIGGRSSRSFSPKPEPRTSVNDKWRSGRLIEILAKSPLD